MDRVPTQRQAPSTGDDSSTPQLGGHILDRYEIFEINEGGFGYVLGVTDLDSGEEIAVKLPKPPLVQESLDAFAKEVAIWVDLEPHLHIVTARFFREVNGVPALFIEYVRGLEHRSMRELLAKGPVPAERALQFVYQICLGMQFANQRREIVHLDLKPENLLLENKDTLKITDFGLAHRVRIVDGLYDRRFAASWPYAPPERFVCEPCDRRSDMFSIGVVLYEMLTGRLPYPFDLSDDPKEAYEQLATFHKRNGMQELVSSIYWGGISGLAGGVTDVLSTFLDPVRGERPRDYGTAISLLHDVGVKGNDAATIDLSVVDRVARLSALQAIGEHSEALTIVNQLLIKDPDNGDYYLAAARSLAATGQAELARTFRERAEQCDRKMSQ